MFWTDGSVMNNDIGGSSCISYNEPIQNPYKNDNLLYPLTVCILKPEGRLCCSYNTEIGGLSSTFKHIIANKEYYKKKNIFIGTDSQSTLRKLETGPLKKHNYLKTDISILWKLIIEACKIAEQVTLHYVPSHENIIGNEIADKYAKIATEIHSINTQNNIPIPLSNLKSYLKQKLIKE